MRKKDPGEKFPWQYLSENNISIWHKINKKISKKTRYKKINNQIKFLKLLSKFGYIFSENELEKIKIIKSFQRRFRPELVNGIIDQECYLILKSLI